MLEDLLKNNSAWAAEMVRDEPEYFSRLAQQQAPKYLWIGCADSRVPANQIVGLAPGEMFVHRNVANVVVHSDLNCLSVMHYAVEVLGVRHIIVTGHYGCGGVVAALRGARVGLVDNWINHVHDVRRKHLAHLETIIDDDARADRLCELNVAEQVINVSQTTVVRDAWQRGQELTVHGWIYDLQDGLLRDLGIDVSAPHQIPAIPEAARARVTGFPERRA